MSFFITAGILTTTNSVRFSAGMASMTTMRSNQTTIVFNYFNFPKTMDPSCVRQTVSTTLGSKCSSILCIIDNPIENFPRELLELFLLGEGHYNYQDVKEVSRAFTGRRIDYTNYPNKMYLEENAFDNSNKTLFGKTGNWKGDDVIDIILGQYQTARHISKSALIFFLGL